MKKLIMLIFTLINISMLSGCNEDVVVQVKEQPTEYSLLNVIERDNGKFVAMKSRTNGKVYLLSVSDNCPILKEKMTSNSYTFTNTEWVKASGATGISIVDSNNVLCNNNQLSA